MNLLEFEIWHNDGRHWLYAAAAAVGVLLVARLLKGLVHRGLERRHRATARAIDGALAAVLDGTRWFSYLTLAIWIGASFLELTAGAERVLNRGALIVLLVQLGLYGQIAVRRGLEIWQSQKQEGASSQTATAAIGLLARIAIWTMVLLTVLSSLGIEISALVAGLGVGGVAAALAVQSLLGDVFASLSIYVDRPFEIGDFIIVGDDRGSVEHIGWRATRVRSLGGEQIIFANGELIKQRIHNYGRMQERRIDFRIGIEYGTPADLVEKVPGVLKEAVEQQEGTRFDRAHFKEYGDSALVFEVVYYVLSPDYTEFMDRQQAINFVLLRRFEKLGISFAFPTRTLHLKTDGAERTDNARPPLETRLEQSN
ncbi:MAG: mechanosensitive ion channel family protein [Myxococcales bacterium]|nr:mechanosensitive ion channel family protein [Myxococcales bacterium]MCB9580959.1 mechanosensitive ion channel family protein [Polyangiaceae bacterium]